MKDRHSPKPNPEVLSEPVRTRLLERATELDAAYRVGGTVAELRAAAIEAGILAPAFDAALAEMRDAEMRDAEESRASVARLRCLPSNQAADLARPFLRLPTNTVVYSPERTPGELTIRATRDQIDNVRSVLDRNDGAGSPACTR